MKVFSDVDHFFKLFHLIGLTNFFLMDMSFAPQFTNNIKVKLAVLSSN